MSLQANLEVEVGLHFRDTKLEVLLLQESLSTGDSNVISKTFPTQEEHMCHWMLTNQMKLK